MRKLKKLLFLALAILTLAFGCFASTSCIFRFQRSLDYTLNEDGESYSVSYGGIATCTETEIIIPATYNDLPVTKISHSAFSNCLSLTSVTIPDSVTSIDNDAFRSCIGLKSITIPDSVTSIGDEAFLWCSGLRNVTIGSGVTSIGNSAFGGCDRLVEVINKSNLAIEKGSEDYGSIGYYALTVHNDESKIVNKDGYLFITDTDNNANYLIDYVGTNTVLTLPQNYNGDNYAIHTRAFCDYGNLTSVTIPDNVTSIGDEAFKDCKGLASITIPDSVTFIGSDAFSYCKGLTNVTIGNGVTSIGSDAFCECSSLTSVKFNGTMEEWNAISKDWKWNDYTGKYTVTCIDGTLDKDGNVIG